jgi:hypothetical protein
MWGKYFTSIDKDDFMTVADFLISISSSGVLAGILIWLSREWMSARLKSSIQHEYDQKLEAHKAKLKAESDVALIELRATLKREADLHAAAHASFSEGQKAAIERKLDAIDKIWGKVLQIRANIPSGLRIVDNLNDGERIDKYKDPKIIEFAKQFSKQKFDAIVDNEDDIIERVRPYVGEYIWAILVSYEVIILRLLLLWRQGLDAGARINWDNNSDTRQLLKTSLTDEELTEFDQLQSGRVSWMQQQLELKILTASIKVISGEEFAVEALAQAKLIQQRADQLKNKTSTA